MEAKRLHLVFKRQRRVVFVVPVSKRAREIEAALYSSVRVHTCTCSLNPPERGHVTYMWRRHEKRKKRKTTNEERKENNRERHIDKHMNK